MRAIATVGILGMAMLVGGCTSDPKKEKTPQAATVSIEAKQLAAEERAPYVAEFSFKKGSTVLTNEAKNQLKTMLQKARTDGKIQEVKVVTWGDSEYPSVHTKKLSQTELDLVNDRNSAVQKYIDSLAEGTSVKTISMAERPGAISEMIGSTDSQVKKSLEQAGIPTTDTSVKMPSKASRTIVIITLE